MLAMKNVFGDALVSAPIEDRQTTDVLPSPEELKGRILLKAKNLYAPENEQSHARDADADHMAVASSDQDTLPDVKSEKVRKKVGHEVLERIGSRLHSLGKGTQLPTPLPPKIPSNSGEKDRKVKMSFELLSLLVCTVGVKCRGLSKPGGYTPEHIFSLSEKTANKLLKDDVINLIKHAQGHLIKLYPKGARINSTNYDPLR